MEIKAEFILPKDERINKMFHFDRKLLLYVVLAFFIGRASIMDKLTPFGIAFITAYVILGKLNIFIFVSVALGMFTIHGLNGVDYFLAITVITFLFNKSNTLQNLSIVSSSIISGMLFALTKLIFIFIFKELFVYDIFIVMFEALVVFALTYIFCHSLSVGSVAKAILMEYYMWSHHFIFNDLWFSKTLP